MKNPWDIEPAREDLIDYRDKETIRVQAENLARKSDVIQDEHYQPNDAMWTYMREKQKELRSRPKPQLGRCSKCNEWTMVFDINDSCCGDQYVSIY